MELTKVYMKEQFAAVQRASDDKYDGSPKDGRHPFSFLEDDDVKYETPPSPVMSRFFFQMIEI